MFFVLPHNRQHTVQRFSKFQRSNKIDQAMEYPGIIQALSLVMATQSQLKYTTKLHTVYYSKQDVLIFVTSSLCLLMPIL